MGPPPCAIDSPGRNGPVRGKAGSTGAGEGRLDYSTILCFGPVTTPGALVVRPWLLALVFAEAVALGLYALQRTREKAA